MQNEKNFCSLTVIVFGEDGPIAKICDVTEAGFTNTDAMNGNEAL